MLPRSQPYYLTLTEVEDGVLQLRAVDPHDAVVARPPSVVPQPVWFDENVPWKGYTARFTWREMCQGSFGGGREKVLEWCVKTGPRRAAPNRTMVLAVDVARAKVCLAVYALRRAIEEAEQFEF